MRVWIVPMSYVAASFVCGQTLPRLEHMYLPSHNLGISVASAQACLSASTAGMMALTGVVFAVTFVMVQFSAIAYSPRLVRWFVDDRMLYHSIGFYSATFIFAFFTLAWVDRDGSGRVPMYSTLAVGILLMISMLLFVGLVQRVVDLQITKVLQLIGDRGRSVIREMFDRLEGQPGVEGGMRRETINGASLGPVSQTMTYSGHPRSIAKFDIHALVQAAQRSGGVVGMVCGVGDTLVDGSIVLRIHGATTNLPKKEIMQAIHLDTERTFEQDPKYAIRLLVDIAIKALSPAINDPTTAVQAIDQIEDLLHRLARQDLETAFIRDLNGDLRLIIPLPSWEDYLSLAFDEIRLFGAMSIQVIRRLRAALAGVADSAMMSNRAEATQQYLKQLDLAVGHSLFNSEDKIKALQEDRQGLGLSKRSLPDKIGSVSELHWKNEVN
jgi:uncharacterized membrane protein